jgi:hypothetical protein
MNGVEIARVKTTGCPESCPGPEMVEREPPTWDRDAMSLQFHLRLIPCPHTISGQYLDSPEKSCLGPRV